MIIVVVRADLVVFMQQADDSMKYRIKNGNGAELTCLGMNDMQIFAILVLILIIYFLFIF